MTPQNRSVTFETAMAVLDTPQTRLAARAHLQTLQNKGSETCGQTTTRQVVARALTAAEDWLEYNRPRDPDRARIKSVRRRVEATI
jgi:hypothetical protein